jgi:hypothetical protein
LEGRRRPRRERLELRRRLRVHLILAARRKPGLHRRRQPVTDADGSAEVRQTGVEHAAEAVVVAMPARRERVLAARRRYAALGEARFSRRRDASEGYSREQHLDAKRACQKQRHEGVLPCKTCSAASDHVRSPFGNARRLGWPRKGVKADSLSQATSKRLRNEKAPRPYIRGGALVQRPSGGLHEPKRPNRRELARRLRRRSASPAPHARSPYSGMTSGRFLGNFAIVAGSRLRVSATISGGECASQSDKEMSA